MKGREVGQCPPPSKADFATPRNESHSSQNPPLTEDLLKFYPRVIKTWHGCRSTPDIPVVSGWAAANSYFSKGKKGSPQRSEWAPSPPQFTREILIGIDVAARSGLCFHPPPSRREQSYGEQRRYRPNTHGKNRLPVQTQRLHIPSRRALRRTQRLLGLRPARHRAKTQPQRLLVAQNRPRAR